MDAQISGKPILMYISVSRPEHPLFSHKLKVFPLNFVEIKLISIECNAYFLISR